MYKQGVVCRDARWRWTASKDGPATCQSGRSESGKKVHSSVAGKIIPEPLRITLTARAVHHFLAYLRSVLGWIGAALLFVLIRFVGVEPLAEFQGPHLSLSNCARLTIECIVIGATLGSVFHLLNLWMEGRPALRRRGFGIIIAMHTVSNVGLVLIVIVAISLAETVSGNRGSLLAEIKSRILSSNLAVLLAYVSLVSFLFTFVRQVNRKAGPGVLWKMMTGKYHRPREEELIFMFLDLQGSTAHAERLGHVRFSQLIQDCFNDVSVVTGYRAQIYKYVGDGVILFWAVEEGLSDANCLRAYFAFEERLQSRASHYESEYGVGPEFKAAVNIGPVMVLEVGEIKREITYLGDVLNTAAGIRGKCNELGANLLISEALYERFGKLPPDLEFGPIGEIALRGREQSVEIFSVWRRSRIKVRGVAALERCYFLIMDMPVGELEISVTAS